MPTGFEPENSGKHKVEEILKSSKVLTQELEASLSGQLSPHAPTQRLPKSREKCTSLFTI
jgi:hypothetical protein